MKKHGRNVCAFSLLELMFVISIVALLCAMLLPVFSSARAKSRSTTCVSNLHQIGIAISAYAQDYDDSYPSAKDAEDEYSDEWGDNGSAVQTLPFLNVVLDPYIRSSDLWRCPSDIGFDFLDTQSSDQGVPLPMNARPTCFTKFGMSYSYRTDLSMAHVRYPCLSGFEPFPPYTEHGSAEICILRDANGGWHGGGQPQDRRYNALMADSHAMSLTSVGITRQWFLFNIPAD